MRRLAVVMLLALVAACRGADPAGDRPNILLISVDTLRPDHLGAYGYPRPTSPNIDALARRGTLFENALTTAPWTLPSHTSLLTGMYPAFHGVQDDGTVMSAEVATLAGSLRDLDYHGLAVVSHVYVAGEFGLDLGFDRFDDSLIADGAENPVASEVVDRFLELLSGTTERPWFAFVHFFDPHWDYAAPGEYGRRFTDPDYEGTIDGTIGSLAPYLAPDRRMPAPDLAQAVGLYDGEIAYVDAEIGRLLDAIDEETIVVLTADHGEEFKEHRQLGHGRTLYEEQLRVPLIVSGHPAFRPGARRTEPVSLVDVAPTLLDLVGGEPLPEAQGVSLARPRPEGGVLFAESLRFGGDMRMARRGDHKLIHYLVGDRHVYYDLEQDPRETRPLERDPSGGTLFAALTEYTALADRGWQLKLLARNNPLRCRVKVRTEGRLVDTRKYFWNPGRFPGAEYARFSRFETGEQGRTLSFEVELSRMAGQVRFETDPYGAPVTFEIDVAGGEPGAGAFFGNGERLPAGAGTTLQRDDPRLTTPLRPYEASPSGVHLRTVNPPVADRGPELSDEAMERLRSLGYVE